MTKIIKKITWITKVTAWGLRFSSVQASDSEREGVFFVWVRSKIIKTSTVHNNLQRIDNCRQAWWQYSVVTNLVLVKTIHQFIIFIHHLNFFLCLVFCTLHAVDIRFRFAMEFVLPHSQTTHGELCAHYRYFDLWNTAHKLMQSRWLNKTARSRTTPWKFRQSINWSRIVFG